jgi:hypothetical protein
MREPFQLYKRRDKWMARFWNADARWYVNTLTWLVMIKGITI